MGSDKSVVVEKLGNPSAVETEPDGQTYVYSIPYKSQQIPKVLIWFGKDDRVLAKKINLFEQSGDAMTQAQIENLLKNSKFKLRDAVMPKDGHNYSSFKYMYDDQAGVEVEINSAQANNASFIHWYGPNAAPMATNEP
jgi:outer membrane protein assembly factor BamE (lipoprotein component of BamABCDE complex)